VKLSLFILSASLFRSEICNQAGQPRIVLAGVRYSGKISWPLFPFRTWATILLDTVSASRTGSLKSRFEVSFSMSGVRIQAGFTTLANLLVSRFEFVNIYIYIYIYGWKREEKGGRT
jgi:hypothetical protein